MGRIREFSCHSCGEVWQLQLGHGMNHAALENVLEVFSEDIQKRILEDTQEEQIPSFEFNYCPAVCGQCRRIVEIPSIYLHHSGRTYLGVCPSCNNQVEEVLEGKGSCPHCGSNCLLESDIGRWD